MDVYIYGKDVNSRLQMADMWLFIVKFLQFFCRFNSIS